MAKVNVVDLEFDGMPRWTGTRMTWIEHNESIVQRHEVLAQWLRGTRIINITIPVGSEKSGNRLIKRLLQPNRRGLRVKNAIVLQRRIKKEA